MHIKYITWGSYGDVRPAVSLGLGLQKAGHKVSIIATPEFENFITSAGLEYILITEDEMGDYIPDPRLKPNRPTKELLNKLWSIFQDADAIICTPYWFICSYIAEKLEIPCYISAVILLSPTNTYPFVYASRKPTLGSIFNWMSYYFYDLRLWQSLRQSLNQWREEVLGLPRLSYWAGVIHWIDQKQIPCLYSHSPAFVPKCSNYSDWIHVTGYWFLDSPNWQPPEDLVEFIEAGSPPVYVGIGNADNLKSKQLTQTIVEGIVKSGQRGILLKKKDSKNSDNYVQLPKEVFTIEWASYDWLFPRMKAVVHHGGLGTIHAAFKAGVPSIIFPLDEENYFWGNRLVEQGLTSSLIEEKRLSAEKLAEAIKFVITDQTTCHNVTTMSKKVQAEDGVSKAVEVFHQHLQNYESIKLNG
jgi:sterol 3beta-glucosyltransferase